MSLLDRKDLTKVTVLMKGGRASDEAIAAASDLSKEKISEGAREQAVSILASLLPWSGCEPKFYAGDDLLSRRLNLQIPVPEILVLAARHAASCPAIAGSLPRLRGVVAAMESQSMVAALPLDSAELYACAQAQAPHPVEDFLHMLPAGKLKPTEILHRLLLLGVLKVEPTIEAGPRTTASSRIREELETQIDDLLARFEVANYYEILSVPTDASEDQIHAAYHDLARQYHPDRFEARECGASIRGKAERLFTHITGAYTTLGSSAARANYDEMRKTKESQVEAAIQGRATADVETEKMAEALFHAGCASLASKDFEKAARHLKEAVFLRPEVARYQLYLGVAQAAIPRYMKEAEQHLLRALQLDPMRVEGRLELGKLYMKVNLPKRAEAQFFEVLRWDPDNRTARRLLEEVSKGQTVEVATGRRSRSNPSR
jgi:tetratricopeptide (TPR) repeat protein